MVGAIAAGFGSAVQSMMNAYYQSEANRENFTENAVNRNFNRWMYEDSKKYNSIQNQVNRMRSTGLNPAFALGGLQAGAAHAQSAPSALGATAPQVADFGAAINNGLQTDINAKLASAQERNLESNTKKTDTETLGNVVDNLFKRENWMSIIGNRNTDTFLKRQMGEVAKLGAQYDKLSMQQRLTNLKYEGELKDAQIASQDIINQFLPHLQSATYNELVSRAVANYATGRSSLQTAMAAVMNAHTERGKLRAQFGGDEKSQQQYFSSVMDLMFEQRRNFASQSYNNLLTPWGYDLKFLGTGIGHKTMQGHFNDFNYWFDNK